MGVCECVHGLARLGFGQPHYHWHLGVLIADITYRSMEHPNPEMNKYEGLMGPKVYLAS